MKLLWLFLTVPLVLSISTASVTDNILEKRTDRSESVIASLDKFIGKMKEFVSEDGIDTASFRSQSKMLEKKYAKYASTAKKLDPPNNIVTNQLAFAKDRLGVLAMTSFHILDPGNNPDPPNDLAHDIVELDSRLLLLQDTHGYPDPQVARFPKIVSKLRARVNVLKGTLSSLSGMSQTTNLLLADMIRKIDKTVEQMSECV